ncbi:unnamed protein product [Albugo candida]|uniref:Uncharacterized protein n=1 Tax=Albugo candida TaxID=65357 RepID=A0A024GQH2_9STRA|nr:unnamed protein product [Albugo candida]|eukprot:CCI49150.1 unnamed protein product [Albugo candida]
MWLVRTVQLYDLRRSDRIYCNNANLKTYLMIPYKKCDHFSTKSCSFRYALITTTSQIRNLFVLITNGLGPASDFFPKHRYNMQFRTTGDNSSLIEISIKATAGRVI